MRARVASCTSGDWLITRDTVFFETLASRAMSLMVALRQGLLPVGLPAGAFAVTRVLLDLFRVRVMDGGLYERIAREAGVHLTNGVMQPVSSAPSGSAGCRCR